MSLSRRSLFALLGLALPAAALTATDAEAATRAERRRAAKAAADRKRLARRRRRQATA